MSATFYDKNSPFFSVIVPAYNRARFLPLLISSVISQTFESFELIIVDDGSSDNTNEVVQYYSDIDPRVIYLRQSNLERGAARNNGISYSRGLWISFLDSDDYYLPDHLHILHQYIEEHSIDCIIGFRYFIESSTGIRQHGITHISSGFVDSSILLKGNPFACNFAIKNDCNRFTPFQIDRSLMSMEDWIFLLHNASFSGIYLLPKATVVLKQHSGRSMNDNSTVVSARLNALDFLSSELSLDKSHLVLLTAHSYLFCAIHLYLDCLRFQSLYYFVLAVIISPKVILRFDLLSKFLVGRNFILFISNYLALSRKFFKTLGLYLQKLL